jgi:ATP-binding cassette subfamily C exporter for protease/lipase
MIFSNLIQRSPLMQKIDGLRADFLWAALFSMIANLLMIAPSIYMLQVFDRIMLSGNETSLVFLTLIILVFFVAGSLAEWFRSLVLVRVGVKLDQGLGSKVFDKSFEQYLGAGKQHPVTALTSLSHLRQFLTGPGIISLFDLPWTPIYVLVIFLLHPILGLVAALFCMLQLVLAYYGYKVLKPPMESALKAESRNRMFLRGKLKNAEPVEAMGMLDNLRSRWLSSHDAMQDKTGDAAHRLAKHKSISRTFRYAVQSLTLAVAAFLVVKGEVTVGAMMAVSLLVTKAFYPLDQIVETWKSFATAKVAFLRLDALLRDHNTKTPSIIEDIPQGLVVLDQVITQSPSDGKVILDEVSVAFRPGQITAIIGPSGSGKSTLARCLVGVWHPTKGQVLLDGKPLSNWDAESLGPHIGYLPQKVELMAGSIAENISRFYKLESDKVIDAAKAAGIHEMILRLPKGYDTQVGVSGRILSGGQRQRIGLARAIYGMPALIVLDEPNSHLDDVGERALVTAMLALKKSGKTLVLISHRTNILSIVDDILVLREGKVLHHGPKTEVLKLIQQANSLAA